MQASAAAKINAIQEPRSARMDQRTKPTVKARIEAAADLLGIEASAFVVMAAYERAEALLASHTQTLLSQAEHEALLAVLDAPPSAPTSALQKALALHRAQIVKE